MPHLNATDAAVHYEQFGSGPDVVWIGGGGDAGDSWHEYQIPYFERSFRNTTFANRGVSPTVCDAALPWTIEDMARDAAELIESVCSPPVAAVGLSMGGLIVQQLALDRPDLLRVGIPMGSGAHAVGWSWDYMRAEVEFRESGGRLDGMMDVIHYAAMLYPARALGDHELWPRLRESLVAWMESGANEESLIGQWDACLTFDVTGRLGECSVPLHVFAFAEDVQAPPQEGKLIADLCPTAELHLFDGMGHCSIYGHTHDVLNPEIERIVKRYL